MTEEQFWKSNPRIIKVYEEAWKNEQNRNNELMYMWTGNYMLSAAITALSQVMQPMLCKGQKSRQKYVQEPIRLFPMTEEEKLAKQEEETLKFKAWSESIMRKYKNPDTEK